MHRLAADPANLHPVPKKCSIPRSIMGMTGRQTAKQTRIPAGERRDAGKGEWVMYEMLTRFIPAMEGDDFGKWVQPVRDVSSGEPTAPPFVIYEWSVRKLREAVLDFADDHMAERAGDFIHILEENHIAWRMKSMIGADVSALDGRAVFALLAGAFEAERSMNGAVLIFCRAGCMERWLKRLKEIDEEAPVAAGA